LYRLRPAPLSARRIFWPFRRLRFCLRQRSYIHLAPETQPKSSPTTTNKILARLMSCRSES
jgi:hypothetical protein